MLWEVHPHLRLQFRHSSAPRDTLLHSVNDVTRILDSVHPCDPEAAVDGYFEHRTHEADQLIVKDGAGRLAP